MAVKESKKRFEISMEKTAFDMISKFAQAYHMTKSDFIVSCCLAHINAVVHSVELEKQKAKKKGGK